MEVEAEAEEEVLQNKEVETRLEGENTGEFEIGATVKDIIFFVTFEFVLLGFGLIYNFLA